MNYHVFFVLLSQYKYFAIFPIAVLEGPVISIISGLLAARGIVSFFPVLLVVFLGDFVSDAFFYFVGRRGKTVALKFGFLKVSSQRLSDLEYEYIKSPWKTMIIAKISYGLGTVFMIAAGLVGMSRKKFLLSMAALNALRSLMLVTAGYFFGRLLLRPFVHFFRQYILFIVIVVPTIYLVVWRIRAKRKVREEKLREKI